MRILIKVKDDKLCFQNRKRLSEERKVVMNTNLVSNDELLFTDGYILKNTTIVSSFLMALIKNYNITTLTFQNMEVASVFLNVIPKLKNIKIINFESDEVLPYKLCEKLSKCQNLQFVSATYIPAYMFEMLDKYNIIPESRDEILFTSNFMQINDLSNYATIFYKYTLYLEFPLSTEDINDFSSFCAINRNLKIIHVNIPNRFNLEEVIDILRKNKKRNIKIIIHGDVHDAELASYLKKNNKIVKRKYGIKLCLRYSDEYIKDNIASQTNNNILRMCGLLVIVIIVVMLSLVFVDNYKSMMDVAKIQEELQNVIIATDVDNLKENMENNDGKEIINTKILALTTANSETVGWLKVNNTNIDYPILQTTNNTYYLDNNFKKEPDPNGWLFMDYTNDINLSDDNTVIYGHNRFVNGVMFGTLHQTLYRNWYTNPDNQIITFETLYGTYHFQVFSIYITPTTGDYIETNFATRKSKMEFINLIKERSIYDFGITLNEDTKILTLSTCQSDTSRLVLHAALLYE